MIKVRVPATSANLGPGFDSLGVALSVYNVLSFEEIPSRLEFTGFLPEFENEDNMVYQSMFPIFEKYGRRPTGIRIGMEEGIPVSRGLGSSAGCIVGGLMGAAALLGEEIGKEEIFQLASAIEGHPDNVAPAVFGNLTVSVGKDNQFYTQSIKVAEGLSFVALIPDMRLSTKAAREVLPKEIPFKDAVKNVGRAALLPWILQEGQFGALKTCLEDSLHEPYRAELIPDFYKVIQSAEELGAYGAYLSGAGSTIMALCPSSDVKFPEKMEKALQNCEKQWQVKVLEVDTMGSVFQ